jgi:hypothetical protein
MLRLISDPGRDVSELRTPDCWIVDATACLPENDALVGVVNQDAVHGERAALADEGLILGALQADVATSDDEGLVTLKPANFEQVGFGTFGTDIGDVARNSPCVESFLNAGYFVILILRVGLTAVLPGNVSSKAKLLKSQSAALRKGT